MGASRPRRTRGAPRRQGSRVWVFGGGIDESVAPVRVAGDGTVTDGAYPENEELSGGFAILELPSPDAAEEWAARFAVACRCPRELREFMYDPES